MMMATIPNNEMGTPPAWAHAGATSADRSGFDGHTALVRRSALHQTYLAPTSGPPALCSSKSPPLLPDTWSASQSLRRPPRLLRPSLQPHDAAVRSARLCRRLPLDGSLSLLLRRRHMAVQKTQKVPRIVANGALKRRQQASVRIRAQSICNSDQNSCLLAAIMKSVIFPSAHRGVLGLGNWRARVACSPALGAGCKLQAQQAHPHKDRIAIDRYWRAQSCWSNGLTP